MNDPGKTSLSQRDRALIWHPYTQHQTAAPILPIRHARGSCLFDEDGKSYIDAISSWWTNIHGHSHPYIAGKIFDQAQQLEHVIFAGCTHEPAVSLAARLLDLLAGDYEKVFYSDNGSTAVEVALKMAIQFQQQTGHPRKKKIIAFNHSYHGDTFGAMSVSDRGVFTRAFNEYLFDVIYIDPPDKGNVASLRDIIQNLSDETACFIYEPLVQGAGGMRFHEPGPLDELIGTAKSSGILCIADEVMTGFGRTGKFFASEYMKQQPDIICLSKGLTGGSLPLAVTACTQAVFDAFLDEDLYKTFFHGHSYTANPLACAAALASLDLLEKEECKERIAYIDGQHRAFVQKHEGNPRIMNLRSLGTILAFEFHSAEHAYLNKVKEETMREALERGVLIRPLGNTVYIMPPYFITNDELAQVFDCLEHIISTV